MVVGDLVKINKWCDARNLRGRCGIILAIEMKRPWMPDDSFNNPLPIASVLVDGQRRSVRCSQLSVVHESR